MKRAGDLLNFFLDNNIYTKAVEYNDLFKSWRTIAGERLAAHSWIKDLDKTVLIIEADHPGWIQILQTKQAILLSRVQKQFPELTITALSFFLCKDRKDPVPTVKVNPLKKQEEMPPSQENSTTELYNKIKDDDFKKVLMKLEKSIKNHNK